MVRSATLTTVPSRSDIPEPSVAAAMTARPVGVPIRTGDRPPNPSRAPAVFFPRDAAPVDRAAARRARRPARRTSTRRSTSGRRLHDPRPGDHQRPLRARPRLHGAGRARGRPQRPRAHRRCCPTRRRSTGYFYADVWHPQEIRHGQILDELQVRLGRDRRRRRPRHRLGQDPRPRRAGPPRPDPGRRAGCSTTSPARRPSAPRCSPTTCCTTGSPSSARPPSAETIVAQIKRQEPAHHAFYTMSARGLNRAARALAALARTPPAHAVFAPVGANNPEQTADFGDLMMALGIDRDLERFATAVSRVEPELLGAAGKGLPVPEYVLRAFRDAVEAAQARRAAGGQLAVGGVGLGTGAGGRRLDQQRPQLVPLPRPEPAPPLALEPGDDGLARLDGLPAPSGSAAGSGPSCRPGRGPSRAVPLLELTSANSPSACFVMPTRSARSVTRIPSVGVRLRSRSWDDLRPRSTPGFPAAPRSWTAGLAGSRPSPVEQRQDVVR